YFLSQFLALPAFAFDDGDLQIWSTQAVEKKLNDNLKVKVENESRFGDNVRVIYYDHIDGGITFKTNENLDLGVNYRQVWGKKKGKWKKENRPHLNGTLKWKWSDFKFKNRNRFEWRRLEGKEDGWRYRNKLSLYFPWKWEEFDVQPYVADEVFLDFAGGGINRNRVYAGVGFKPFKYLKADLYYIWQTLEGSRNKWTDWNVIGIKLKAVF
ncbi:MAG: DUF2490 domain-containing protein, partial [Candidatus Omnitrophota bacterium]